MQNMWYIILFINVWLILTAIRLPFCSPSHVSRTSGQILWELVWCGLRSWCKHEWTAVEQMDSWRVWMSHSQTTVWRWQGPPTAALWRTPYAFCPSPKHLPSRILLQWSPLQTTKLHYYYLSILKRFNNWNTNIAIGVFLPESSSLWAPPVGISGDACWPLCWEVQGLVYWPLALLGHSSPPWFLPRWS